MDVIADSSENFSIGAVALPKSPGILCLLQRSGLSAEDSHESAFQSSLAYATVFAEWSSV